MHPVRRALEGHSVNVVIIAILRGPPTGLNIRLILKDNFNIWTIRPTNRPTLSSGWGGFWRTVVNWGGLFIVAIAWLSAVLHMAVRPFCRSRMTLNLLCRR